MKSTHPSEPAEAAPPLRSRLLAAVEKGWQSARANVFPGLVIVFLAGLIVAAYDRFPAARNTLAGLVEVRQRWGVGFSMAASALGAGLIPGLYLLLAGRSRRGRRALPDLLFTCLVWAMTAAVIDRFYAFQAWLWGAAVTLPILLGKMALDQFLFTPLIGLQIPALGSRFRDLEYDVRALWAAIRTDWIVGVVLPMLVACWITWIPGTLVIHALPLPLQIPMMALIQCFFALEMAYASSRM